jgi:hypothetical protein
VIDERDAAIMPGTSVIMAQSGGQRAWVRQPGKSICD